MAHSLYLFDMDGTLIDTDLIIVLTMKALYDKYRPDFKMHLKDMVYVSGPPLEETIKKEFPGKDTKALCAEFAGISMEFYDKYAATYPGCFEVLDYLKSKGQKMAVVTGKARPQALHALKVTGLDRYFPLLISGTDLPKQKPAPDGLWLAMEKMGVSDPATVLSIGDSPFDYLAAEAADIDCALFDFGPRRLAGFVKPKYLLSSYKELLNVIKQD